jgi:hypothetical protein
LTLVKWRIITGRPAHVRQIRRSSTSTTTDGSRGTYEQRFTGRLGRLVHLAQLELVEPDPAAAPGADVDRQAAGRLPG